jgi:hypothetical protein
MDGVEEHQDMTRDFQRQKVYNWEKLEYGWDDTMLTLEECQEYTNTLIRNVTVTDGRGRRTPCAKYQSRTIALPKFARKKWIVLHEVAHFLGRDKHGPQFLDEYIKLLAREYGRSIQSLRDSATDYGLKLGPQPAPTKDKGI